MISKKKIYIIFKSKALSSVKSQIFHNSRFRIFITFKYNSHDISSRYLKIRQNIFAKLTLKADECS